MPPTPCRCSQLVCAAEASPLPSLWPQTLPPCSPGTVEHAGPGLEEQGPFPWVFRPPGSYRAGGRSPVCAPRRGRLGLLMQLARRPGRPTTSFCPVGACLKSTWKWVGAMLVIMALASTVGKDRHLCSSACGDRVPGGARPAKIPERRLWGLGKGVPMEGWLRMGRGSTAGTGVQKRAWGPWVGCQQAWARAMWQE